MGRSHLYRGYKLAKSINCIGDNVCVYGQNCSIKVLSRVESQVASPACAF